MKLIWTKNNQPLSIAIRSTLKEPVSHFGIVFDNGIVFHSNLLGTHIEWYGSFIKKCDTVYSIDYTMSLEEEEAVYLNILNTYDGVGYDYGALFYFAYRGLLYKIANIEFPKTNKFQSSSKLLCTELAGCLPDNIVSANIKNEDLSIISPYKLYLKISKNRTERI